MERRLRLLRAIRASLAAGARAMPTDLKTALKREARDRAARARPTWREAWRAALGRSGLGCGLGAALAASLLAFAVRLVLPRRPTASGARASAPAWNDAAASAGLQSLWTDDDGRDRDDEG